MTAVSGTIAVSVSLSESATEKNVESSKSIALSSSSGHTSGRVAVITGTVGTSATSINLAPLPYRDAAGDLVSMTKLDRIAFQAEPAARLLSPILPVLESLGHVTCTDYGRPAATLVVRTTSGTASYTLVLVGE